MKKIIAGLALFVVAAAALFHMTGCETESVGDQQITITPNSTGLYNGQYADFTASGGYEYTWSLDTPSWGLLSDTKGSTVRYTSRYDPGTSTTDSNGTVTAGTGTGSAMQVIRVTSRVPGSSTDSSDTNGVTTSGYMASGSAQVEHLPTPVEPTPDDELYVTPSFKDNMAPNTSQEFVASGGNGEYYWSLADNSYGKLNAADGSTVVYTATYNPGVSNTVVQSLIVVSGDMSYSATITQTGY